MHHKLPVLFTHFGDQWIRGSETLLLDLLRHLDPAELRPIVWCNGHEMAQACEDAGYTTHRSDFEFYFDAGSKRFSPTTYLNLIQTGIDLARRHHIRVLHANSAAPTQWLLPVARRLRLPLLTHLHIDYLRRSRVALLLHQADSIIGVSHQVNAALLRDGVPETRTRVIYNGIDFDRLTTTPTEDLRTRFAIPKDAVVIGAIGSLIPRKGIDVLLHATAPLTAATPPHLLIAGTGPEQDALAALAETLGLTHRVHFMGFTRAVGDFYRACDIIALPSRADAFGLVLAEAGFSRLPVVATRVGGIPEVVLDTETGLLIPPNDAPALTSALQRLLDDPALRHRLGAAGHDRATRVFSAQRMAAEFQTEYARLAALPRETLGWTAIAAKLTSYRGLLRPTRPPS